MTFSPRQLSVLAYASGFTLWLYRAESDGRAVINDGGFFSAADDMLAEGDMVMVSARDGGRMLCVTADGSGLRTSPMA